MMRDADSSVTCSIAARLNDSTWISTDSLLHHYHLGTWGEHVLSCIPYQVQFSKNIASPPKQVWSADLLHLSPNPSSGLCKMKGLPDGHWSATVIDLNGRMLLNKSGDGSSAVLDISTLTSGMYIIRIQDLTTGKTAYARIILQ